MAELKKPSVKNKVEAVIFSTGRRISLDDMSKLCRSRKEEVVAALLELKKEYDEKQSSLMLIEEGDFWKFTVRDTYIPIVRKIVTETELTKSVLETLAVIAFKYPILQSDLIKVRTNKAYDHLVELESAGYITRQKHGRTNLIKLTERFFKYFDLTEDKLKDKLKDFESIAAAIKEKENEADKIKEEMHKKAEELKMQDERIKKEIESLDKSEEKFEVPLETYEAKSQLQEGISKDFVSEGDLVIEKEKIGELEVIEEKSEKAAKAPITEETKRHNIHEHMHPHAPALQQPNEKKHVQISAEKEIIQEPQEKRKSKGIISTPEMEVNVNKKVEDMLHGGKENKEPQESKKSAL